MIDIDHFKSINDTHGHLGGDTVLAHAGRLVLSSFRIEDNPCRYGGEEFCVLLTDTSADVAMAKAQDLVSRFEREQIRLSSGVSIGVTISVGVNDNRDGRNLLRTIQGADDALYEAKRNGRNQARRNDA